MILIKKYPNVVDTYELHKKERKWLKKLQGTLNKQIPTRTVKEYKRQYRQDNKAFINFLSQNRKLAMMQRTPLWLGTEEMWLIEEAYQLAALRTKLFGFAWHVDHVIPLRGKKVSGLHTPQNLSVIPGVFNMQKTNKFEVEYA